MNCPNCGASVPAGSTMCRKCGSTVEAQPQPQQNAQPQGSSSGQPVNIVIRTDGQGNAQGVAEGASGARGAPRSKIAAGLFGIFLGVFGVHRFYLGYTGIGIVMLLLTILTCGYGGIATALWGLIEGIIILTGGMKDAWGRPLN